MHNQIYLKTKEVFNSVNFLAISCDEVTMVDGWLQGKVVHFLCHNPVFCKVTCIYMLLTWHKNNKFSNMWLDLNYQLELEYINKKIATYIHQIYNNELLKLKNVIGLLFVPLYVCVYEFYLGCIIKT
jgi:hypothetical protein